MKQIVGVRFSKTGKLEYMDSNNFPLKVGNMIVAESERGLELARVVSVKTIEDIKKNNKDDIKNIKKIIRQANRDDIENQKTNEKKAKEALDESKKIAKDLKLNMKMLFATYTLDESKLIIHFSSEERVDFRELVKELASKYKVRIELRQVGPRDEIKSFANLGACGKEVCCRTFLPDFESVTIKMAKEQGLQINMPKISGNCGRLMCCLKYEETVYKEKLKDMPKINEHVKYDKEDAKVVGMDILSQRVRLKIGPQGEERFETVHISEIKREKKKD